MPAKAIKKSPLFDQVVSGLRTWLVLKEKAREATNEFNRHNTDAKKTVVKFLNAEDLPSGTVINIDGVEFTYGTAVSRKIDPEKWHDLYTSGEITKAQYFGSLSVGKDDAKLVIGEDQVERICMDVQGSKADIRCKAENEGMQEGVQVILPEPIKAPTGIRPRVPATKPVQSIAPIKRVIKVGAKK